MTRSATLEIHVLDVSHGDSVLVVNRDLAALKAAITAKVGAAKVPADPIDHVPFALANGVSLAGTVTQAMLVDAGNDAFGPDVVAYLEQHGVLDGNTVWTPRLTVVGSHFHEDHISGLRSLFHVLVQPPNAKKKQKRITKERYRPGRIYVPAYAKKSLNGVSTEFYGFVTSASTAATDPSTLTIVKPGGLDDAGDRVSIDLGTGVGGIPIRAYAVAAAMGVYDCVKKTVVPITAKSNKVDQNDYSIVLVVEYGSFRCLLGGDIAGDGGTAGGNTGDNLDTTKKPHYSSTHADVETTLAAALRTCLKQTAAKDRVAGKPKYPSAGYCTVVKADHHGSASSVDVNFLAATTPLVFVASAGARAKYHGHPTQYVLNRVTAAKTPKWFVKGAAGPTVPNSIKAVCLTEVLTRDQGKAVTTDPYTARILGDVVVRPVDESVKQVQDAKGAAKTSLEVQVYGTGIQTHLYDPDTALRPVEAGAQAPYPIKPAYYTDQH